MERVVIVLTGPTAVGKSAVGINLALRLNTEIISADSRQIYKSLNIGTAKPSYMELKSVKHHLIDYLEPDMSFNAGEFEKFSLDLIEWLFEKNKIPIVVGGTGLYIRALTEGIINEPDTDEEYRNELLTIKQTKGNDALYNMLLKTDPLSAEKMLPQNWKRVIRALEVIKLTGKPIWEIQKNKRDNLNIRFIKLCLNGNREILYNRINDRVEVMINNGLIDEVESLLKLYDKNVNSLNTVGYKEIISYLDGEISLEDSIYLIKRNTRHYAKRQTTWFKKEPNLKYIDISFNESSEQIADLILDKFVNI